MKSQFPVLGNKTSLTDVCGCVLKIYVFIQMISQINCLPVNPCLRVSFWGNPNIWEDGAPYGSSQPHGAPLPSFLLGSASPVFFFFFWLCWVFVAARWLLFSGHTSLLPVACGILIPRPGLKPTSPALEGRFLTPGLSLASTGPPGKSPVLLISFLSVVCLPPLIIPSSHMSGSICLADRTMPGTRQAFKKQCPRD